MASLRDLGLSEYEARVYRALLRTGATTAKELSRASDVPMGRIYDVLNGLEEAGLVRSQATSRPKKYVGVEPETALDRLLDGKKEELRERARQYEQAVETLSEELDPAEPTEEEFWTAVVGAAETVDLLAERLSAATESVAMVADSPGPQFDIGEVSARFVGEFEAALDRGVRVRLLLAPAALEAVPPELASEYRSALGDREGFTARISPEVSGAFTLIDDAEVCIEVPNPLEPREALAMFDLKDPEFAGDLQAAFEPRWTEADPLPTGGY